MTATAEPDDAAPLVGEDHIPDFFGHPRGLWYLAFTEAWERFSYYGMQALLVLLHGQVSPASRAHRTRRRVRELPPALRRAQWPGARLAIFGAGQKIGLFWPVAFHFLNSIAFAHMLPVSLALFAKYAPKAINATIIGLYYLAFFAANTMVRLGRRLLRKMATTNFWLLHAAFAAGAGLCFVVFKFVVQRHLRADAT